MNKRRRFKAKRRQAVRKAYITTLNAIEVEAAARWREQKARYGIGGEPAVAYPRYMARQKGDDDGQEYGHPGDHMRGLE